MKRLLLLLAFVAGCGYLPGSADDPAASPSASPTLVAVNSCNIRPDAQPNCDGAPIPECGQPDCDGGSGYVDPTPSPTDAPPVSVGGGGDAPAPAPAPKPIVTVRGTCGLVYFANTQMNVFVYALIGDRVVAGASATVYVTGTDSRYPAPPSAPFSGVTSSPAPPGIEHDPRVPIFVGSFALKLPGITYDATGHQVNSPYATYRCHGTVSLNGSTDSF